MLFGWIGEGDFRRGMKAYLEALAFGNAKTEDLWKALEEASGKPVGEVMSTWTKQQGYPLLEVVRNVDELEIKQSAFAASGKSAFADQRWKVPIKAVSEQGVVFEEVMKEEKLTLNSGTRDWLCLNSG